VQSGERALDTLRFLVHLIASTLGVTVTAAILAYSVALTLHPIFPPIGSRTVHWILTETPYFPVQIVVGLLWGFQLGRRYGHKVMFWTWIVPALGIALLILFAPLRPTVVSGAEITKTAHFFGWACLPQNHCFEQVGFTLPLYSAIAYSMGALLARVL
jgi:hypothetical protein